MYGITLPDLGISIPDYVTAVFTDLGTIMVAVLGAAFAIFLVRRGVSWVRGFVR